ncbi:GntR family transcriptional regulator [Streptomyces sp. NPDC101158]|uniref:GntR family transcriptional regulator n=1 Tax=Streptomyces sp. NPDC101158 TaxID=3366117 RepID=UPI0037F42C22
MTAPRKVRFNASNSYNANFAGRTALYRLFTSDGALLYVGITCNLDQRLAKHTLEKLWWHQVARMTVEWRATRAEALQAEEIAEREEHPRFCDTRRLGGGWTRHARRSDPALQQQILDTADELRKAVLEGRFQAGELLRERRVAEAYGISIAMTRSALGVLTQERLVGSVTNGFLVRPLG